MQMKHAVFSVSSPTTMVKQSHFFISARPWQKTGKAWQFFAKAWQILQKPERKSEKNLSLFSDCAQEFGTYPRNFTA